MKRGRHELCNGICFGKCEVHDPAYIADGSSCRHGAERDDLCDMILAVFLPDIVNDLSSSGIPKIHVDIRHGHTSGI